MGRRKLMAIAGRRPASAIRCIAEQRPFELRVAEDGTNGPTSWGPPTEATGPDPPLAPSPRTAGTDAARPQTAHRAGAPASTAPASRLRRKAARLGLGHKEAAIPA
jgi:hypothetical protein